MSGFADSVSRFCDDAYSKATRYIVLIPIIHSYPSSLPSIVLDCTYASEIKTFTRRVCTNSQTSRPAADTHHNQNQLTRDDDGRPISHRYCEDDAKKITARNVLFCQRYTRASRLPHSQRARELFEFARGNGNVFEYIEYIARLRDGLRVTRPMNMTYKYLWFRLQRTHIYLLSRNLLRVMRNNLNDCDDVGRASTGK